LFLIIKQAKLFIEWLGFTVYTFYKPIAMSMVILI